MDLKQFIAEEFDKAYKTYQGYVEVFKNPTAKEMREVSRKYHGKSYIRFIATNNGKTVWVFDPNVFHGTVWRQDEKKMPHPNDGGLWGTAKFVSGKWIFDGSDEPIPKNFDWKGLESRGIFAKNKRKRDSVFPGEFNEAFEGAFTHPITKEYVEIFSNPSAKEMVEAARKVRGKTYLRFIADGKAKRLYVFSPLVIHRAAAKQIKRYSGKNEGYPRLEDLWGVAVRSGAGWKVVTSDVIEGVHELKDSVLEQDWSWLNKKIDVTPLLKKIKAGEDTSSDKLEPTNMRGRAKKVTEALQSFAEEFAGSAKAYHSGIYVEIFKNPTSKEMRELPDQVRFCIDGRGRRKPDVYLWDAALLHEDASKELVVPYPHPKVFWGIGKKEGNKVVSTGGIYPIRDYVYNIRTLKDKQNPEKYESAIKKLSKIAEDDYLDPKWENKWVDLSDFYKGIKELVGKNE